MAQKQFLNQSTNSWRILIPHFENTDTELMKTLSPIKKNIKS